MNKEEYFSNIKTYKYIANKSLGQNFLINPSISENIVSNLEINDEDNVLEIGCGLGSLSYFLMQKSNKITFIDVDERMTNYLLEHFKNCENKDVKRMNILKEDVSKYSKIIGNLPYYITSGIIEYLLLNATNAKKIVLMTQKEVYLKLIDPKEVSPLSILLRYVSNISNQTNVGRNNFTPIPHVDSCYFSLITNENIKNTSNNEVYKLMKTIFTHRRKNILNCLSRIINDKQECTKILESINVDINSRPENLSINDYFKLLDVMKTNNIVIK
ncbi:MAG TPA: ribosomal RNA small subunit methyltransferase A [Firmicutes bacterium]|nr:ribosomal RNA small subunit methyltransferase A [Bacillota bacterium]